VTASALAATSAAAPKWYQLEGYTFDKYVSDFSKEYKTLAERLRRKSIFESKLKVVMEHNANPRVTYQKGINHMSDWTQDEFHKLNGGKLHETYNDVQRLKKQPHVKQFVPHMTPDTLPLQVDYRNTVPMILTGVKNQGQCGSCWAHGSTEDVESMWALATGNLFVLSQQQFTSCAPNPNDCGGTGGCGGSTAELAYDYLTKFGGQAEEWTYPYTSGGGNTGQCKSDITKTQVKINGYTSIESNNQTAVMEALATVGPLVINVEADTWQDYESGVFSDCQYNITIDHVVQLVGYGTDIGKGTDYWIIRNSWSPAWGEHGFIRLQRTAKPTCGWDVEPQQGTGCNGGPPQLWACGMCGILFDALYPNVAT